MVELRDYQTSHDSTTNPKDSPGEKEPVALVKGVRISGVGLDMRRRFSSQMLLGMPLAEIRDQVRLDFIQIEARWATY